MAEIPGTQDSGWWQAYAAAYAAVLSTVLFAWELRKHRSGRRAVIIAQVDRVKDDASGGQTVPVTLRNAGGVGTEIRGLAFRPTRRFVPVAAVRLLAACNIKPPQSQIQWLRLPFRDSRATLRIEPGQEVECNLILWAEDLASLRRRTLLLEVGHTARLGGTDLVRVHRSVSGV